MSTRGTAKKAAKAIADGGKAVLVQITSGYGDIVTHKAGCRDINRDADRFEFQTGYAKVEAIEDVQELLEDEMADALLAACRPCCDKAIKAARKAAPAPAPEDHEDLVEMTFIGLDGKSETRWVPEFPEFDPRDEVIR